MCYPCESVLMDTSFYYEQNLDVNNLMVIPEEMLDTINNILTKVVKSCYYKIPIKYHNWDMNLKYSTKFNYTTGIVDYNIDTGNNSYLHINSEYIFNKLPELIELQNGVILKKKNFYSNYD
jgi:ABC-type transport system involved in Fe-S cluster assembly fused permease/ATPase subunit